MKSSVRCNCRFTANTIGESNVKIPRRRVISTPVNASLSTGEFATREIRRSCNTVGIEGSSLEILPRIDED